MKNVLGALVLGVMLCGCSNMMGGVAGGVVGAGAGYELAARRQMERLDSDLNSKKIDQKEYDIRKNQIERGSLVY